MKIGIFSDVHGHLDELNRTLALLERLQVDEIVCGGDLVDKGVHSDAAVELIQSREILCVQGNHDTKAQYTWLTYNDPLKDRTLQYLSTLPMALDFEWAGISVHLCHTNPWHDTSVYVYPTLPTALFKLVIDAVDSQVIILGHTHHPMHIQMNGRSIVNPGSIYGNRDRPERTCGVLSLPECGFAIYDIDTGNPLPLQVIPVS